jgi:hypothetical protein
MKLITATFALLFSLGLFAQAAEVKTHDPYELSRSKSVLDTEKKLDERITKLNEELKKHTVLFRQKIKATPAKTVIYKGTADGDDCKEAADQTANTNTCIKLEVFDFQDSEWGKSELNYGSRSKSIILFYAAGAKGSDDPMKEEPGDLQKIVFRSVNRNFKENLIHFANIKDEAPATANGEPTNDNGGAHDDKIVIFYQNGFPSLDMRPFEKEEQVNEKGVGKYKLKNVENSKTNAIRNTFKKSFFVKNLDYFNKLFAIVADTNQRYALKKYKESNDYMKSTLKY